MNQEKIGKFIKELRKEKHYSQNSLSEEIHVTRQAISNWENGKAIPDSDILLELSNIFDVSINEILSGERKVEESNLEEIALSLVDENNKKKTKIKLLLITSVSLIISLLLLFLGYYFIANYNSIKVYRIKGESDNFKTYNGILVTTKSKSYLRLSNIDAFNKASDYKINNIKLYYLDKDNNIVIIYKSDDKEIILEDVKGYNEFYINNNLKYVLDNLYLEVKYNDNKSDIIKLKLTEDFKNNLNLFKNSSKKKIKNDEVDQDIREREINKINEIIATEELKTNLYSIVRQELIEKPKEEYKVADSKKIEETLSTEPVEEIIQAPVVYEEELISNEEPALEEIDFDQVVNHLKEVSTEESGIYLYEFIYEDKYFQIMYQNNIFSIDILYDNTIESWQYYKNETKITYQTFDNYSEREVLKININEMTDDDQFYFKQLHDYFKLFIEII